MINFDIAALVPKFIQEDRTGAALVKAIEAAMRIFCGVCADGIACVNDPQKMPEWRLNEMAWELGIKWYDSTADIESKRRQISRANDVMRTIGTKSAVMNAVSSVFGDGYITEWFQYSGDPYHFRVYAGNADDVNNKQAEFLRLIEIVKNERSVLDGISYTGVEKQTDMTSAVIAISSLLRITAAEVEYVRTTYPIGSFVLGSSRIS